MSSSKYDRLSALANNKTNWKVKVRLTRIWSGFDKNTGNFKGYNMILLDDDVRIFYW